MTVPVGTDLDLYDVAFLAGGPARVVDTAVVALLHTGRLRLHSPGRLATADLSRRHPVEAAVLDAVGPTGHRSVDTIRWRVLEDARLRDVEQRLRGRGLIGRAGLTGLRPGSPSVAPSRAGRRVLTEVGDLPGVDAEAMRVARGGRAAMRDKLLRAAIFEPPDTTQAIPRGRRRSPRDHSDDPQIAAYRAGAAGMGGGLIFGAADGGGFDGGGGGGGDGGG
jgi:hypothetical protein